VGRGKGPKDSGPDPNAYVGKMGKAGAGKGKGPDNAWGKGPAGNPAGTGPPAQ
jgi:hypothetical protein